MAVSSSSFVKIVGTWKSVAIDRSIPRIAFGEIFEWSWEFPSIKRRGLGYFFRLIS